MTVKKKLALTLLILSPAVLFLAILARSKNAHRDAPAAASAPAEKGAGPASTAHEMASLEVELKKSPAHSPILLRMAELKREAGNAEEAVKLLRKAAQADDDNAEAKLELGRALFESGDANGAIAATQAILNKAPKNVDALYNLGAIYGNLGNDGMAREYFNRAVAAGPATESGRKAKDALGQLGK